MQIAVTFRHLEPNEGVKAYVKEKVEKLEKYLENLHEAHVVLSSEKFRQIAEITIVSNGVNLNSEGRDSDLYAAIDQMVDKMERQVRERRGKEKRRRGALSPLSPQGEEGPAEEGEELSPTIQRRRIIVKPMSVEEAAAQLNLVDQDFFIFVNSESTLINVLYRRKDGGYDWIEPSLK